jgi:hypothetical protein
MWATRVLHLEPQQLGVGISSATRRMPQSLAQRASDAGFALCATSRRGLELSRLSERTSSISAATRCHKGGFA